MTTPDLPPGLPLPAEVPASGVEAIATREWCVKSAEIEGEAEVGAGTPSGVEARVCEDEDTLLVEITEGIIGELRNSGNDLRSSAFSYIVPWVKKALFTQPPAERSDHE